MSGRKKMVHAVSVWFPAQQEQVPMNFIAIADMVEISSKSISGKCFNQIEKPPPDF